MYVEGGSSGRAAVQAEIKGIMGEGHEEGNKQQLIERLVTLRLMQQAGGSGDDDKIKELLKTTRSSEFDEGPEVEDDDDRTTWHFEAAHATLKKVEDISKTLKQANFKLIQHELVYIANDVRGFCGVCLLTDQEHEGRQSTQLMCTTCRTWVCKSSVCLMAHLKFGTGAPVGNNAWDKCEKADFQQTYRPAAAASKKRKENREEEQ